VLTHAHPDHAWGLKNGAPCRVYGTEQTWHRLKSFPLPDRALVEPRAPFCIHNIVFEAFPVEHSLRAPAVGYRITAGRTSIFYVPGLEQGVQTRVAFDAGVAKRRCREPSFTHCGSQIVKADSRIINDDVDALD
jgi:phosphoribosyl 1,2-cyclic phosphodiesterase